MAGGYSFFFSDIVKGIIPPVSGTDVSVKIILQQGRIGDIVVSTYYENDRLAGKASRWAQKKEED